MEVDSTHPGLPQRKSFFTSRSIYAQFIIRFLQILMVSFLKTLCQHATRSIPWSKCWDKHRDDGGVDTQLIKVQQLTWTVHTWSVYYCLSDHVTTGELAPNNLNMKDFSHSGSSFAMIQNMILWSMLSRLDWRIWVNGIIRLMIPPSILFLMVCGHLFMWYSLAQKPSSQSNM